MRVWTPPLPEPHFFVQGSGRVLCYRGDAVGERRPSQSLSFQNSPGSQCGPSIYRDLSVWGGVRQVGSRETRKKVTVAGRQSAQVKEGTYKNHLGIEVGGTISKQATFSLVFIFHLYNYVFYFLSVYTGTTLPLWQPEDNLEESVFFFHLGPKLRL